MAAVGPLNSVANTNERTIAPVTARSVINSERYRELDRRQRYYDCTQHDHKRYDFAGHIIGPAGVVGERASWYVPLKNRRPSSPYRLGRVIVNAFTNMLLGEQRFPSLQVDGDPRTQDYAQALVKVAQLPVKAIRLRNILGSVGTGAFSWAYINGKPKVNVHNAKNLLVHEWEDRDSLIPRYVSEVYLFSKDEPDPNSRKLVRNWYWYRRDWNTDEDVVFRPVLYRDGLEPLWIPDKVNRHNDGICHVVWVQNLPTEEIDGLPDYDQLYESLDALDIMLSVIVRGATLNLDPTMVVKMDPDLVMRLGIKKGSDNALNVGKDGDARYMELAGSSIQAGLELFNAKRRSILEAAHCVVPDPAEVAASGLSSITLKALYMSMLGGCDIRREHLGTALARLIDQMLTVARLRWDEPVQRVNPATGEEETVLNRPILPPLVKKVPAKLDAPEPADGLVGDSLSIPTPSPAETPSPFDDYEIIKIEREPGEGGDIDARWPPYFLPTADDQAKQATTLVAATGGKAFLSQETAIEVFSSMYAMDGDEEKRRMAADKAQAQAQQAAMFADQNGAMGGRMPPALTEVDDEEEEEPAVPTTPPSTDERKFNP